MSRSGGAHTALVTGATSGIGRAAAVALADAGWWVVATGRDPDRGREVGDELQRREAGEFVATDLTAPGAAAALVDTVVATHGGLRALVNNAGVHFLARVDQTDPDAYAGLMDLNVRAAFDLCRAAVPVMRDAGGGVIVNVSSEAGLVAVPGQVAYNMSKAALIMLTRSLAADHAADGVRAVSVCPGTTRTPLVEQAISAAADPAAHEERLASTRPAGRLGSVEEIAAAIVFCCSDDVAFMTGSEVVVDGGYTAV
ncbi:MAG TPA: SDR family oxidoreductase [Euzebyales bacterium]|nr:SDR family oxidoreductase [Euzebyales bacterium]